MVRKSGIAVDWIIASPVTPDLDTEHVHVPLGGVVSPAIAGNAALRAVVTPWVATVDDDDFLAPEFTVVALRNMGNHDLCFSISQDFYPDGSTVKWKGQLKPGMYAPEDYQALVSRYPLSVHPSTMLVKTELLVDCGGWDESLSQAEDIDCALRLARRSGFRMENFVTHNYRKHDQQMTRNPEVAEVDADVIRSVYRANGIGGIG